MDVENGIDIPDILLRFKSNTGEVPSRSLIVTSLNFTLDQLQLMCRALLNDEDNTTYAFYVHDKEITNTLEEALKDVKVSVWSVVDIIYHPQVRAVTRCTSSLPGHSEPAISESFSPDGQHLASGSGDTTVRLRDIHTQTPHHVCKGLPAVENRDGMDKEETIEGNKGQYLKVIQELKEALNKANTNLKNIAKVVEEELKCSVCLCLLIEARRLECGHMFCKACIQKCELANPYCPVCRQVFLASEQNTNITHSFLEKLLPLLPGDMDKQWLKSIEEQKENEQMMRELRQHAQDVVENYAISHFGCNERNSQELDEELAQLTAHLEALESIHHHEVGDLFEETLKNLLEGEDLDIEEMIGFKPGKSNSREVRGNNSDLLPLTAVRRRMPPVATQSSLNALPGTSLPAQSAESAPGTSIVSEDPVLGILQAPQRARKLPRNLKEVRDNCCDLLPLTAARRRMLPVATQSSLNALPGTSLPTQSTESAPRTSVVSEDPVLGTLQAPQRARELPRNLKEPKTYVRDIQSRILHDPEQSSKEVPLKSPQSAQSTKSSLGTSLVSRKDKQKSLQKKRHLEEHHSQHREQNSEDKSVESLPGSQE